MSSIKQIDCAEAVYEALRTPVHGLITDSMSLAMSIVDQLPTVDAEPRWIPCSERLPEKDGRYLVTYFWQAEGKIYETDSSLFVIVEDDDDYWDFDNVVAWMPLPKPYKEKNDEQDD